jgi:protein gp37
VFDVIADTPQHTYQVLTKRSHRLRFIAEKLDWPVNLWLVCRSRTRKPWNASIISVP